MRAEFNEVLTKEYYDSFGDVYEAIWNEQIHTGFFGNTTNKSLSEAVGDMNSHIAEKADINKGLILNVGCGRGATDRFLAKHYGVKVIGIDVSSNQLREAKKRAKKESLEQRIVYTQCSMTQVPYPNNTFDYLWIQESFFHCHDKLSAVKEFKRVLKGTGRLVLEDTVITDQKAKKEVLEKFGQRVKINDILTPAEYKELFSTNGFIFRDEENLSKDLARTYEMIIKYIRDNKEKLQQSIPSEYRARLSQDFGFPDSLRLVKEQKLGCVLMIFDKL